MNIVNEIINTCYLTTIASRPIAFYSHLIPVILSILLALLVFIKSRRTLASKIFLAFVSTFAFWLICDLILWTSNNYYSIYAIWSFLDYFEIVFYALGLYFAIVFVKKHDISTLSKTGLFILTIPAFLLTINSQSVTGFNQSVCEALNSDFIGLYKLAVEGLILIIILIYTITPFFKKFTWKQRWVNLVVTGSMFLFLSIFGITEYLASATGYYEMNLYSLFLLPVFLVAIIYSVFELDIFNIRILGTHYLVIGLIILMGGQLFFITNTTNKLLTILTIALLAVLSIILFRNLKKESDQRVHIEKLNIQLEGLIKQRESLMHLINHKVKGAFTHSKYIFAGMLDGTFGEVNAELKKRAEQGLEANDTGIKTVDLVLNTANMQKGTVKYDIKPFDFRDLVARVTGEKKVEVEKKGLQMESHIREAKNGMYNVVGDAFWLKEAINNLIENSIKYTREGKIIITLENTKENKVLLSVKDTGIGITGEDKNILFTEGGRGKDSVKINVDSTGYGLYSVKLIIEAHKGRVWAESEGLGKGSTFFIELPSTS